ncbi:PREDICTED: uncharacterized protein LOC100633838 isoform X2 [Amphimedon queenslandica]|uniref:Lysosome-associated membrane glycoprotein 2-like transmembrane domain-containing protein n=1 Tax=Amphimedon queenslandica TaxID=400682 RepID=A0AAN0JLJ2_AMPQE|nr:PREDICTED: uncharacterized protein LOC100633838 isoform X2 [Amphimedon queenslandica]|eukprot:XP_019857862.1 PREDICTED: uncharacterized protein LOC100633838 isoform X2 [Amphimedon queenslandica]
MKEMSLLLGLTLLLTFLALGYTESCGYLIRKDGKTRALINGSITVDIEQRGPKGTRNTTYNVTCSSSSELNSTDCVSCTDKMITGTFYDVTLTNSNENLFANITYTFKADTKNQDWSLSNMTISIDEDEDENNQTVALEGWVDGYKYIMNNVSLDYQRSYQCKANMSFLMNCSVTTTDGNMSNMSSCSGESLYISFVNFQVQAFSFYNDPNATTFGNSYMCDADTTGSKIVPIAVGIALAVLVCIVLIAYLIGRFKSRRQSSYETLK